jgi:hypothetical protein
MTVYQDERAFVAGKTEAAEKIAKRKSRKIWAFSAVGTVLAGGAAFAAVQLFGYGSIDQGAATMQNLTVSSPKLSNTLVPGKSVGGQANVGNSNDFDVKVTGFILKDASLAGQGEGCDPATLTPGGTATTYPVGGGAGHLIAVSPAVTIPAGQERTISAPGVVSQSATATALCGVKAEFAVVAQVGNP